jgi:hypothetical protein
MNRVSRTVKVRAASNKVRAASIVAAVLLVVAAPAHGEVTRLDIKSRSGVPFSGYEKIVGRVFFEVDPANPHNAVIVDLDKAPKNAAGRVEFSADFYIVRPKSGGNGVAIVDIVNRGGKTVIGNFNRVGSTRDPDVGDGFLLKRGFTVAAVGWEFALPAQGDLLRISVPVATEGDDAITGIVRGLFIPDRRDGGYRVGDLSGYSPVDPAAPDTELTVRDSMTAPGEVVARERWQLSGITVTMTGGFEPGRIYELSFRAAHPPVGGLGFAAVRDFAAWMKHDPAAVASAKHVYAFGNSQSGRFLRTFLYQGFNADERDRLVLDAVMANIAGAARLDLNRRWSTPTTAAALATEYPFANQAVADPLSGANEGLLENARAARHQPKIFYGNTGVEYWSSAGRAAALTHVTPDGTRDLELPENVRSYFFAGSDHSPAMFPPPAGLGQQRGNPTDYWWTWRALLVAMDNWVRMGTPPPPSQVPTLAAQTLVDAKQVGFPEIPGVQSPREVMPGARVANSLLPEGAAPGALLPHLVPEVDADGNERGGIRFPEVEVPLATHTGWNYRHPSIGGTHLLVDLLGSYVPFARTKAEREQRGDPRLSIQERYPSRDAYLAKVKASAAALVKARYLLADDVEQFVRRASAYWEALMMPAATSSSR